eukprot:364328-Chlamydomonas_euryale.AAC.15
MPLGAPRGSSPLAPRARCESLQMPGASPVGGTARRQPGASPVGGTARRQPLAPAVNGIVRGLAACTSSGAWSQCIGVGCCNSQSRCQPARAAASGSALAQRTGARRKRTGAQRRCTAQGHRRPAQAAARACNHPFTTSLAKHSCSWTLGRPLDAQSTCRTATPMHRLPLMCPRPVALTLKPPPARRVAYCYNTALSQERDSTLSYHKRRRLVQLPYLLFTCPSLFTLPGAGWLHEPNHAIGWLWGPATSQN